MKRRLQQLPFICLWREFGELRAGVVARGHGWSGDGAGEGAEAVLARAERASPPGDARRRRAGRGVRGARGAAEVPVVAAHGGRLQVEGVVDEDLRGPLWHRGRRVGERVAGRRRRRAGQGPVGGRAVVDHRSWLVPGQRRRQPGRDGRRAVGPGAHLRRETTNITPRVHHVLLTNATIPDIHPDADSSCARQDVFGAYTKIFKRIFSPDAQSHQNHVERLSPSHPESLEVSTERHKMDFIHYRGLHTRLTEGDG